MRPFVLAFFAIATLAAVTTLAPPAAATIPLPPACIGYDMCAPCHDGFAWVGVYNPIKQTWTCGECEVCGNPIW